MLVLTRKPKEEIRIGNNITITIVRIKGQTVRVGINAPRDIRVIRSELTAHDNSDKQTNETTQVVVSSKETCVVRGSETAPPCGPKRQPESRHHLQSHRSPGLTAFGILAARNRERRANELES